MNIIYKYNEQKSSHPAAKKAFIKFDAEAVQHFRTSPNREPIPTGLQNQNQLPLSGIHVWMMDRLLQRYSQD